MRFMSYFTALHRLQVMTSCDAFIALVLFFLDEGVVVAWIDVKACFWFCDIVLTHVRYLLLLLLFFVCLFVFFFTHGEYFPMRTTPRGGGGDTHMRRTGILVVSLRSVNVGYLPRLWCSGQNAKVVSHQGMFRVVREEMEKSN